MADPGRALRAFLAASTVEKPTAREFAAWWPIPGEQELLRSDSFHSMERAFSAFDGIESYACADLMGIFRGPEYAAKGRIRLPEHMEILGLRTDVGGIGPYLLTFHGASGIRLHFTTAASREVRDMVWEILAEYATEMRAKVTAEGLPLDDFEPRPSAWWSLMKTQVSELEGDGETMDAFGLVRLGAP